MDITILSQTIPNWQHGDGTFYLRVEVEESFFASNGEHISGASNGNYFEVEALASSGACVTQSIIIPSTTDALDNQLVRYKSAAIFKRNVKKHTIIEDFVLVNDLAPATDFVTIAIRNSNFLAFQDLSGYSKAQVDALIQAYVNVLIPDSSTLTKGGLKLSAAPLSPTNPIAIGTNDHFYTSQAQTRYGTAYESFNAAITAIGSSETKLIISSVMSITTNVTVPKNIKLVFETDGLLLLSSNSTLNISAMNDPGNRQVFEVESGSHVVFTRGAVEYYNLAWWTGIAPNTDVTDGMNEALYALTGTNGGRLFIPHQSLETSGGHDLPEHSRIFGNGQQSTIIKLSRDGYCFKIGELCRYTEIANLTIDGDSQVDTIGVLYDGEYPNSVYNTTIRNVNLFNLDKGIECRKGSDLNDWEVMQANWIDCNWSLCNTNVEIKTVNSGINIIRPVFYLAVGGTAINAEKVGSLNVQSPRIFGSATPTANVPASDNSRFLAVSGIHNNITIEDAQDENIHKFLETSGNDYRIGNICIYNSLIQSDINLIADRTIISEGNVYIAVAEAGDNDSCGNYLDSPGSVSVIYSKNDYFQNREYGTGTVLGTNLKSRFTGNSFFSEIAEPVTLIKTSKGFQKFVHSAQLHGQGKPAVEILSNEATGLLMRLGQMNVAENFSNGYEIKRNNTDGWLEIIGNQASPFRGVRTNGEFESTATGQGIILKSANGSRWRLTISNAGAVVVTAA